MTAIHSREAGVSGRKRPPESCPVPRAAILAAFFMAVFVALVPAVPADAQTGVPAVAAAPARAEVLVLGVYHMSNPGRDIFNMKADDVLSPARQGEMAKVVAALGKFHPTKIAVEAEIGDERIPKRYAEYVAGTHELTSNETEQIGFRLAKILGHKTVYPVDVEGDFPFQRVVNWSKASGRSKDLDAILAEVGVMVKAQGEYLASHTVLETLLYMNADEKVAEDVGTYYREALFGEPDDWAGADLVSEWFRRNLRIYTNVVPLVESPGERVLVIFGAGHLGWLRHDFASNPALRVRALSEFAR